MLLTKLEPAELRQIDDERCADRPAPGPAKQLDARFRGAAGCDQIVDDQDPLARGQGVLVYLDYVDAVFERVFLADGLPGQLALFPDGDEAASQPVGDGT